jgi:hypothetical protein
MNHFPVEQSACIDSVLHAGNCVDHCFGYGANGNQTSRSQFSEQTQETGNRIINTIPQAEGHTISAPQEPQNPVSHCTDVMEPNTIGATGGPSVRFVPEVAMAMGDDTRWPAPSM